MSWRYGTWYCTDCSVLTSLEALPWFDLLYDQTQGRTSYIHFRKDCAHQRKGNCYSFSVSSKTLLFMSGFKLEALFLSTSTDAAIAYLYLRLEKRSIQLSTPSARCYAIFACPDCLLHLALAPFINPYLFSLSFICVVGRINVWCDEVEKV
jgi:hypothetical protein